jgi:hypothetical protein
VVGLGEFLTSAGLFLIHFWLFGRGADVLFGGTVNGVGIEGSACECDFQIIGCDNKAMEFFESEETVVVAGDYYVDFYLWEIAKLDLVKIVYMIS